MSRPNLLPLPASCREFNSELKSLINLTSNRKALISSILQSRHARRHYKEVSIVLMGNTGDGKTATLNHLLRTDIGKVSGEMSETLATTEYVLRADDDRYDVKDLRLGIIDTKGLNDTRGLCQDACNLVSMDNFFRAHHADAAPCFPNVILICVKATDTRTDGPDSMLTRCLRDIERLNIVDTQRPNVIVVLTFASGITKKEWRQNMLASKGAAINEILEKALGVTAPVVWLENNHEAEELVKDGCWTVLPDGVRQPHNIYKAMQDLVARNQDPFAKILMERFFETSGTSHCPHAVEIGRVSPAKDAKSDGLGSREAAMLREIQNEPKVATAV